MRKGAMWAAAVAGVLAAGGAGAQQEPTPPPLVQAEAQVQTQAEAAPQEVHVPVSLMVLPGVGTHGLGTHHMVNNLSLGLVATHAGRLEGLAASLGGNWVDGRVRGVEAAVGFNIAGQKVTGAQLATGFNVAGADVLGLQSAVGFNVARGAVTGLQAAVGFNVAGGPVEGAQAAVGFNVAPQRLTGVQAAVGVNVATGELRGVQTTVGLGFARQVQGAQLSLVNVGGEVEGAQVGLLNIASRVKGLQLGLINLAGESDAPVGLLSLTREGIHLQAFASDVALTNVALRLGGRYVHSLVTLGYQPGAPGERYFTAGLGVGLHLPLGRLFYTDVDLIGSSLARSFLRAHENVHGQLRVVGGVQLASHLSLFAGVTANSLVEWHGTDFERLGNRLGWEETDGRVRVRTWPGLVAGVQL